MLGNRVWATFTFFVLADRICSLYYSEGVPERMATIAKVRNSENREKVDKTPRYDY